MSGTRTLAAILAVRNEGSRLFGKPLQNIDVGNKLTILELQISLLRTISAIDKIVLAISADRASSVFCDFARRFHLDFVVGDPEDVKGRVLLGASKSGCTDIFRVTTECPFLCFEKVSEAWESHVLQGSDATFLDEVVDGCGFEIISYGALERSYSLCADNFKTEMVSLFIRENPQTFRVERISFPEELRRPDCRLTVDYPEDLVLVREVYREFKDLAPAIPVVDILRFLDSRPDLKSLVAPFTEQGYRTMYLGSGQ